MNQNGVMPSVRKNNSHRGTHLISKVNLISTGFQILVEKPLLTYPALADMSRLETYIDNKLSYLDETQQQSFYNLADSFLGEAEHERYMNTGICNTNGIPLGPGSSMLGIFPVAARINHSCRPNAWCTWQARSGLLTVHAMKDIQEGEEITINYLGFRADTISIGGTSNDRVPYLEIHYRFTCHCPLCTLTGDAIDASDETEETIIQLFMELSEDVFLLRYPRQAFDKAHELVEILHSENVTDVRLPEAYFYAFKIAALHSDSARAKVHAARANIALIRCEGIHSSTAKRYRAWMNIPESYEMFGKSKLWKQSGDRVPWIAESDFEQWSWKVHASSDDELCVSIKGEMEGEDVVLPEPLISLGLVG